MKTKTFKATIDGVEKEFLVKIIKGKLKRFIIKLLLMLLKVRVLLGLN
jgi:hypothetical protein